MRLRTKKSASNSDDHDSDATTKTATASSTATSQSSVTPTRQTHRISMPHNSLFILGPKTNTRWLHGINADKRLPADRLPEELAHAGSRISLTFRHIGTFLNAEGSRIWGQGATAKRREQARRTVNGDEKRTEAIVRAFGAENRESGEFDWKRVYGQGFDVLHFNEIEDGELPMAFLGCDDVANRQLMGFLEELGMRCAVVEATPPSPPLLLQLRSQSHLRRDLEHDGFVVRKEVQVGFRDTDTLHTEITGILPTLFYLDRFYSLDTTPQGQSATASAYEILFQVDEARRLLLGQEERAAAPEILAPLEAVLWPLEERLKRREFVAGEVFSLADCALWPVVERVFGVGDRERNWEGFEGLKDWWKRMVERESVRAVRKRFGVGDSGEK
ncbi:hypothetical protein LTS18_005968 [Coniosporium uncinatum]|uniref:Uncharacterized protein n=1 Tax=Coniosporium uncinatum TaxID=93489 RepID=A0ACC3DR49_9PEZI|nr:hypothetical protein LTS18_005968 [Coniosporium uncinatum]